MRGAAQRFNQLPDVVREAFFLHALEEASPERLAAALNVAPREGIQHVRRALRVFHAQVSVPPPCTEAGRRTG